MWYIVCFAYYIHCYFLVFLHVRLKEKKNKHLKHLIIKICRNTVYETRITKVYVGSFYNKIKSPGISTENVQVSHHSF